MNKIDTSQRKKSSLFDWLFLRSSANQFCIETRWRYNKQKLQKNLDQKKNVYENATQNRMQFVPIYVMTHTQCMTTKTHFCYFIYSL